MKKNFLLFACLLLILRLQAQTCNPSTKVAQVIIYINLPDGFQYKNQLTVTFKNRDMIAEKIGTNEYQFELMPAQTVSQGDLKFPDVQNCVPDKANPTRFTIQSTKGVCSARFIFYYAVHYTLELTSDPPKPFEVDNIPYASQPISVPLNNKTQVVITSKIFKDYVYGFEYRVKNYCTKVNDPVIQYQNDIKDLIEIWPTNNLNISNISLVDKMDIQVNQIKYILLICTNCE